MDLDKFDLSVFSSNDSIKILDVGCGTGVFWKKNLEKLNNYNLDVVFTDYMKQWLRNKNTSDIKGNKIYEIADVENLEKYYKI